jgi:putative aldouronate transport system permease protein
MKMKKMSFGDRIFTVIIYTTLTLLSLTMIIPLLQVITVSLSPVNKINQFGVHLFPTLLDWSSYTAVFEYKILWYSYSNTIIRTVVGVSLTVVMTFLGAYPLSKKTLPDRSFWTGLIVLTMFFSGGLIPSYILIKNLNLINSLGSLVLPGAINTFMLLVVRNFISAIPESLEESAKIDGANDLYILWKIILPLCLPVIATVALYSGVWHWNSWFDSLLYIQQEKKQVLQLILRKIILEGQQVDPYDMRAVQPNIDGIKMAALVVSILPVMVVYPFLQKYFVKGTLVGSVKG